MTYIPHARVQQRSVAVAKVLDSRSEAFLLLLAQPVNSPAGQIIQTTGAMSEQETCATLMRLGLAQAQIREQIARARVSPAL